jgi:hypothetical protein
MAVQIKREASSIALNRNSFEEPRQEPGRSTEAVQMQRNSASGKQLTITSACASLGTAQAGNSLQEAWQEPVNDGGAEAVHKQYMRHGASSTALT